MSIAMRGALRTASRKTVAPVLSVVVVLLLCNAAFLVPSYMVGSKTVCMVGSLCSQLSMGPNNKVFGVPVPAYGVLAYALEAMFLYRWLRASEERKEGAYNLLWAMSVSTVLVSVPLYVYGVKILGGGCFFCLMNATLSSLSLGLVMAANGSEAMTKRSLSYSRLLGLAPFLALGAAFLGRNGIHPPDPNKFIGSLGFVPHDDQIVPAGRPVIGDPKAPTTVVVFSDPVCPACSVFVPKLIDEVKNKYKGKVKIVYRQYPLNFHPQAESLSRLEIWAQGQGKFEEMSNLIKAQQGDTVKVLASLSSIGLDRNKALESLSPGASKDAVDKVLLTDQRDAKFLMLKGTPYFLVVKNDQPIRFYLGGAIQEALNKGL